MNVEDQLRNLRLALDTAIDDARRRDEEPRVAHARRRSPVLVGAVVVVVIAAVVAIALQGRGREQRAVPADPAADLAVARGAVLTRRDLPGYIADSASKKDNLPASARAGFAKCLHADVTIFDNITGAQEANSPALTKNAPDYSTSTSISSFVEIAPDASSVDAEFADLTSNGAGACLAQLFVAALKANFADTQITVTPRVPLRDISRFSADIGDRAVGYTIGLKATPGKKGGTLYYELLFVQRGRASVALYNESIGHPVDHQLTLSLARKVVDRLANKTQ